MNWTKLTKGTKVRCKRSGKVGYFSDYCGFIAQCYTWRISDGTFCDPWCTAGCDLEVVR